MKKGISQEIKERVEAIEGMNILDAAKRRYLIEMCSFRWISRHWQVSGRTVHRILENLGLPIRHGGDAVRAQWIGNVERRAKAGERLAQTNHELAAKGLHIRQGKTKENSKLIRDIAEKLKSSSSFLRPEVKTKALHRSLETRRLHPERMSASQQGASVCYCVNEQVKRRDFAHLDDYISGLKIFRANPTIRCAKTVIWGACGQRPFGKDTDKFFVHKLGVRSDYFFELTAASDN